jgi:hypothetical protein
MNAGDTGPAAPDTRRAPSVWLRTPTQWRREDWLVCALLAVAALTLYWRLWAPGGLRQWFVDGDFTDQFLAFARFEVAELARGRLPLWNPYAYGGAPFWADVQAAVAYPPSLLNALAHALVLGRMTLGGLSLEAVVHIGLAAVFTYAFAREELASRAGGLVAAVAFGFGGFVAGYPPLQLAVLETAVWLPVVLLGINRLGQGRRHSGAVLVAAGTACAILAGHPQTALYIAYTALAYAVWRGRPWSRERAGFVGWTGGSAALGVLAGCAGWLPAAEFLRLSNRAELPYEELAKGFPPAELAGIVVAGLTHWSPLYVGVTALALALAVLPRLGARAAGWDVLAFWLGCAVVAVLLALGGAGPLYDALFVAAPGWDLFRGQERAAFVVSFALAMLAGAGAAAWRADDRVRRNVLVLSPVLAIVLVAAIAAGAPDARADAIRGLFGLLALGMLAAADRPARRLATPAWIAALAALVFLDVAAATSRTNLADSPPAGTTVTPVVAMLRDASTGRVANDDRLPRNFGVMHGIEATSGSSPLRLSTWDRLGDALAGHEGRLWQLLAVDYVVTWRETLDVPGEEMIRTEAPDGPTRAFRLDPPPPRVWRVAEARVLDDEAALARLAGPEFDPLGEVVLAWGEGGEHPTAGSSGVQGAGREAGRVAALTTGDVPAWLVFAEMYYPGWRALVDGREVPVVRANLAQMAVAVPAGEHEVALEFRPRIVGAAIALSVVGWIVIAGLAAAGLAARRRNRFVGKVLSA